MTKAEEQVNKEDITFFSQFIIDPEFQRKIHQPGQDFETEFEINNGVNLVIHNEERDDQATHALTREK